MKVRRGLIKALVHLFIVLPLIQVTRRRNGGKQQSERRKNNSVISLFSNVRLCESSVSHTVIINVNHERRLYLCGRCYCEGNKLHPFIPKLSKMKFIKPQRFRFFVLLRQYDIFPLSLTVGRKHLIYKKNNSILVRLVFPVFQKKTM